MNFNLLDNSESDRRGGVFLVFAVCLLCLVIGLAVVGVVQWLVLGWLLIVVPTLALCVIAFALAQKVFSSTNRAVEPVAVVEEDKVGSGIALHRLIEQLEVPALHIASTGHILAVSNPAIRVFQLENIVGQLAAAVIRQPRLMSLIESVEEGGTAGTVEITTSPVMNEVWIAHVLRWPGRQGGIFVMLEDRTGVRRAEQARADFLANASHELRTPLTSLAGFIETMRGPAQDDKESWDKFLEIMATQTERMQSLIGDLLSLSRIEFSEHEAPDKQEDLVKVIQHQADALRPLGKKRRIKIKIMVNEDSLPIIAFKDELEQVIQNLVSNAMKYGNDKGAIEISAGYCDSIDAARETAARQLQASEKTTLLETPVDVRGAGVWLRVADDGQGIEGKHLPRLGERFYRVDTARDRDVGGTGLGLAIVKHIMARHRGGMAVESEQGVGTAFGVWFPAGENLDKV